MKKLLFIIAISFSPLIQADYVIKFSSQSLSVPAKTVPSIVETFDYNSSKTQELSSILNDTSFKFSY